MCKVGFFAFAIASSRDDHDVLKARAPSPSKGVTRGCSQDVTRDVTLALRTVHQRMPRVLSCRSRSTRALR